jgi:Spy/CpxP family protein refolding chaperone
MKRMIPTVLLVSCLAGGPALLAQQSGTMDRAAQAQERLEQLTSRLKLTPEQTERLKPIVKQEVEELRAVRERLGSDTSRRGRATMLREMRGVQEKYAPQINAILTPEQQQEWKKIKEERRQQLKEQYGKQKGS